MADAVYENILRQPGLERGEIWPAFASPVEKLLGDAAYEIPEGSHATSIELFASKQMHHFCNYPDAETDSR